MLLQVGQVQTVQLEVSASVCPRVSMSEEPRCSLHTEQMGTKEVAVCWNYRGALIDNLPG